jgi:uncharacterized protein (TIRG00374 family)
MSVTPQQNQQHAVPSSIQFKHISSTKRTSFEESAPLRQNGAKKKWRQFAVRAVVTLLLFAFLLKSVSWSALVTTLIHVHHTFLLLGLAAGVLCLVLSAYCWRSLVLAEHIQTDLARLINLYLVGIAFSHFLPTNMGGDAVKAFYVGRDSGNIPGATSAVLMSRVASFFGMLLIAFPALLIMHAEFTPAVIAWFLLLSLLLVGAIGGAIFIAVLLPGVSSRFLKGTWTGHRIFVTIIEIGNALKAAIRRPRALGAAILYGMLFWIASFLNYYGYGAALGLHTPLSFYAIAVPFISIVASLPVSINGFGVREGAFVYLCSTIHIPAATSLLVVLLADAQILLFGVIGGCIYLTMGNKTDIKRLEAQPMLE